MRKILLLATVFSFLISCGGVKKTQEAINSGNYEAVIQSSVKSLASNKTRKSNQPYIILLEEAFKKNYERDVNQISFLKKEGNSSSFENIYNTYHRLKNIQEQIKPLLPLRIVEKNRNAKFTFKNYDDEIISSKNRLTTYLYTSANHLLNNAVHKEDYKKAFEDFNYLNKISPNYKDSRVKIEEAHAKGLDYVNVKIRNNTNKIIPVRLEDELLNFNTYGLNDLWTEYHTKQVGGIKYDYEMFIDFRDITVTPEQIKEIQLIKEKQVKDGFKYVLDTDGQVVLDKDGKKVKTDKFKTVKCSFYQFTQFKSAQVSGIISFVDTKTKQQINSYPLTSNFIFEHNYANYSGDKRALSNELISLLNLAEVPFPSNEQMVYDAGEDLKLKLKNILTRHRFN